MDAQVPWQRLIEALLPSYFPNAAGKRGLFMREGTTFGATIVAGASSSEHQAKQRDPEMKQTRKSNQWFVAMKAHIGVDAVTD